MADLVKSRRLFTHFQGRYLELSQQDNRITVHELNAGGESPIEDLADVWGRLHPLLVHWRKFNRNEEAIRDQQHALVRDGCFLMPSPFDGVANLCAETYWINHRFFFRMRSVAGSEE